MGLYRRPDHRASTLRYGDTDVLVPPRHGEWLAANVPDCVVKIDDTAGHFAPDPENDITENMRCCATASPLLAADRAEAKRTPTVTVGLHVSRLPRSPAPGAPYGPPC